MVAPFLPPLKRWINEQKKRNLTIPDSSYEQYATDDGLLQDIAPPSSATVLPQHVSGHAAASAQANDLLAMLRSQATNSRTVPLQAELANSGTADRLKTMLTMNINHAPAAQPPQSQSGGTDLLAMLRQGTTALTGTAMEPRLHINPLANTAHELTGSLNHQQPLSHPATPSYLPMMMHPSGQDTRFLVSQPPKPYVQSRPPTLAPPQPTHLSWNGPAQQMQPARPFERTGDPQFARDVMSTLR